MSYKIWVKYGNDNKPVKVDIKEHQDVDDLKSIIKEKLSNQLRHFDTDQMTLRKHGEEVDLEPDCEVDESFVNTSQTPIQVFATSDNKIDEEIQKEDWKWPCFEEKKEKWPWGITRQQKGKDKKDTDKKQYGVIPFEVVYFTDSDSLQTIFVDLISQPLIEILRDVILTDNDAIYDIKPRVEAQDLFHVMDMMKSEFEISISSNEEKEKALYLKHLIRFLEQEYSQVIKDCEKVKVRKKVQFDMLWAFYTKGVEVWYRCDLSGHQVGGIIFSTRLEAFKILDHLIFEFHITIRTVDYDGHGFKYCDVKRKIKHFKGERSFSDLPVVPFEFFKHHDFLKKTIRKNGELFYNLAKGRHFMNYEGPLLRWKQEDRSQPETIMANGRVMIDLLSFATMNPNYNMGNARPPNKCDVELSGEFYLEEDKEIYCQITPVLVYGFSFTLKEWGQFLVFGFSVIEFDKEAFNHLVMSQNKKDILRGLVGQYSKSDDFTKQLDPIPNKGKGCIFLCYGPPGTGKTLTAESVAEFLEQPLWIINIHELGMNPASLEKQLIKIQGIAFKWNAILLLDEADIYLEARNTSDLNRNAMTGVFLRQLEYNQGVLFLTTNRVTTFDDAICSRICMFFHYPRFTLEERREIWTNFIKRTGLSLKVDDFIQYELNGREIRNILHTAQMLAKSQDKFITSDDIKDVIMVIQEFRKDLDKDCSEVKMNGDGLQIDQ